MAEPFRDVLKALGWAVLTAATCAAAAASGLFHGLGVYVALLLLAPALAGRYHQSVRLGGFTAAWLVLFLAAGGAYLTWAFRDFHFRAVQG